MVAIGKVSLRGVVHDEFHYTMAVAAGVNEANINDAGRAAVSMSTTANTVKLAVDGEKILGRLEIYEDRRPVEDLITGAIALKGGIKFIINPDLTGSPVVGQPAVGGHLVGAVNGDGKGGFVRAATSGEIEEGKDNWLVVEVGTDKDGNDFAIAINV